MNRASPLASLLTWCRRLWVMTGKELLQLCRDKLLLCFVAFAFTLDVCMSGSGVSLELRNATVLFHDDDHSRASRDLRARFQTPYFDVRGEIDRVEEGIGQLDRGTVMMVVDIPPRFEESLRRRQQTSVQLQIDMSNAVLGGLAEGYAGQIIGRFSQEYGAETNDLSAPSSVPAIQDECRVLFNPNQIDPWFFSISELLQVITMFSILLPAAALAREKERGTVEQLLVAPLSPLQILLPKLAAMMLVILVATAVSVFGVLGPVFHVPMKGSLVLFFTVTAVYVGATAGLGLLAATVTRNLAQVAMLTILILAPMMFLSGTFAPPEAMPAWMRGLVYLSPLHYYIDAAYGILLKGADLSLVWDSLVGMTILGILTLGMGLWRFRKQSR